MFPLLQASPPQASQVVKKRTTPPRRADRFWATHASPLQALGRRPQLPILAPLLLVLTDRVLDGRARGVHPACAARRRRGRLAHPVMGGLNGLELALEV